MHLTRLILKNFRCFEHRTFDLDSRFTLLVGTNATGKTAILDALAIALGAALMSVPGAPTRTIRTQEVRRTWRRAGETWAVHEHYPSQVAAEGALNGAPLYWQRDLRSSRSRTTRVGTKRLRAAMHKLVQGSLDADDTLLPFIGYYGTGRLWLEQRLMTTTLNPAKPSTRFSAYHNCLNPGASSRHLKAWVKRWALMESQRSRPLATLQNVLEAIAGCVECARASYFDFEQDDLVIEFPANRRMPFSLLSDGQRSVAATVADIAMRCSQINPHLSGRARLETPGVVLIDELDQHLHPRWQRRAVDDLLATFPKLQFVATSHSPFIVQSLHQGRVINLDDGDVHEPSPQSIEDIVENLMGVEQPQRSRRFQQMVKAAEEYLTIVDTLSTEPEPEQVSDVREKLDRLEEPFADNPAYVAFLRLQRGPAIATPKSATTEPSGSAGAPD